MDFRYSLKIIKYPLFILGFSMFFSLLQSCASSDASKAYCDETVKCLKGYECIRNKCIKADKKCSPQNKYGYCEEKDKLCDEGVCKTLKEIKCKDVTCSNHGICDLNSVEMPICICSDGYYPVELNCIKEGIVFCDGEECKENQHCEHNECTDNSKLVQCDRHISIPEYGEIIVTQFEIHWENGEWEEIKKCDWKCKQGYKKDESGNSCIKESELCSLQHPNGICENENQICINGNCQNPPEIGDKCNNQNECPSESICILNGIEEGYCTKPCETDEECGNYKCGNFLNSKYCLKPCNNILDCRDDFTCNNDKLCRPKCTGNENCKDYQICDEGSGLCINQDLNCDMFSNNPCTDSSRACYPFEELGYTACSEEGNIQTDRICNKNNICIKGNICTDHDNNPDTPKRCLKACKTSLGTSGNNPSCGPYEDCIAVQWWEDLGYCKYNSNLKPVGLECHSDYDCDFNNGTCMAFERYNICVASGCSQQGQVNTDLYPNEVICVGMNVNGTWKQYWMDTCQTDDDCYSDNFICYENTSYPYIRKYCRPKP